MFVYHFHPETGAFLGVSEARPSPLEEGVYLVPAHATSIEPPVQQDGFVRVFRDSAWGYVAIEDPETPPVEDPDEYVPPVISDRQFFQILAVNGLITQGEALQAVQVGEVPAAMEAFIVTLPADEQFAARMLLSGATTFQRTHPLASAFGAAMGMSSDQVDDLWRAAAAL